MDKNISVTINLSKRFYKSFTNIKKCVKRQNTVIFFMAIGLFAAYDAINTQKKRLQSVCQELEELKNGKGE